MKIAHLPANETFRLLDLYSYKIIDTPPENNFDELVELAAQICDCPISMITLMGKDEQWFKAKKGVELNSTPRNISFCAHTILQEGIMVVEDTEMDNRFSDNPLVTGDTNVRFYAGAPIFSATGYKLGTVCVIDTVPHTLTDKQARGLTILANQVTKLLELRKNNQAISEQAAATMKIRNRVIGNMIRQSEEEKKQLAYNMHEDLAQRIASSIYYLQAASAAPAAIDPMLHAATNQLKDLLVNVQQLSYNISPLVIDLVPTRELVADYVDKIKDSFQFSIRASFEDWSYDDCNSESTLAMLRIMMHWLQALARNNLVSKVLIVFKRGDNFLCTITDNGPQYLEGGFEQVIIDSMVYERTAAQNGNVEWCSGKGKNTLKIELPFANAIAG